MSATVMASRFGALINKSTLDLNEASCGAGIDPGSLRESVSDHAGHPYPLARAGIQRFHPRSTFYVH